MKTVFISDIHLSPAKPENVEFFLEFLKKTCKPGDQLYILGDLFEFYIGSDPCDTLTARIKQTLRDLGIPIFIMHGNRDFLMEKSYINDMGATLLPDEYIVNLFGRKILLMHGDSLCTHDKAYVRFRKIVRHRLLQFAFRCLPLTCRQRFATHARLKSQAYTSKAMQNVMDVSQAAVEAVMEKYEVDILIHGHTHQPCIHYFTHQGRDCQRIVLSDWNLGATILICSDSDNFKLTNI